jgi:transcription initiation factor IIE alpha subunit
MSKTRFQHYIERAIGKLQEAESTITYTSYPERNKEIIIEIQTMIDKLEDMLEEDIG